jgi:hypothetical protein
MNRQLILLCLVAVLSCVSAKSVAVHHAPTHTPPTHGHGNGVNADPRIDTKVHDNKFYFESNSSVSVSVTVNRFEITHGQPYHGVFASGNEINIKAGRKGSSGPAAAFNDGVSLVNMLATEKILDAEPKDLNFVMFANISITFDNSLTLECQDFRLGQGHVLFTNNWWIASKNCLWDGGDVVCTCTKDGGWETGAIQFHIIDKSDKIYVLPF